LITDNSLKAIIDYIRVISWQLSYNNGISTEPLSILFSFIVTHQLFGWFTGIEILFQIEDFRFNKLI